MSDAPGGVTLLIIAAIIGLLPAWIASRKGYGFGTWWLFGALLFILALPLSLMMKPDAGSRRECPHCRTWIDKQATVCAQCGRDVPAAVAVEPTRMDRFVEEQSRIPFSKRPEAPRKPTQDDTLPSILSTPALWALSIATFAAVVFAIWAMRGAW